MAKSIATGWTDYRHQTFEDMLTDLTNEKNELEKTASEMQEKVNRLIANGYWNRKVISSYSNLVSYSIKFFTNTAKELEEIHNELQAEVMEHHWNRLYRIAELGGELSTDYGKIMNYDWQDEKKDYGTPEFDMVEDIYKDGRGMAGSLTDMSNMAGRLKDFKGKKTEKNMENKNEGIGSISGITIGNNSVLNIGHNNVITNTPQVSPGNFEELRAFLKANHVGDEDINELNGILKEEKPNDEKKEFGPKVKEWVTKMLGKARDGSWAIALGAAGKLLADGLKWYNGWFGG